MAALTLEAIKQVVEEVVDKKLEIGFEKQAVLINNAFLAHTEYVDQRFNGVEIRLDRVEGRLDKVENRLDAVENRLSSVEDRLERVAIKVDKALHVEYVHLSRRVDRLEKKKCG